MEAPAKKNLSSEEFLTKVLLELPVPTASEVEQAHFMERHLGLDRRLDEEQRRYVDSLPGRERAVGGFLAVLHHELLGAGVQRLRHRGHEIR